MTALELWKKIAAQFLATPLPGVPQEYVRNFLTRFEAVFIDALQKRFDALPRTGHPHQAGGVTDEAEDERLAALEAELLTRGFAPEAPRHGATAVWSLKNRIAGIEVAVDAVQWEDELQLTRRQGRETTDEVTVTGLESLRETLDLWGIAPGTASPLLEPDSPRGPAPGLANASDAVAVDQGRLDQQPMTGRLYRITGGGLQPLPPDEPPVLNTVQPSSPVTAADRMDSIVESVPVQDKGWRGTQLEPVPPQDGGLRGPQLEPVPTHDGGLRAPPLEPASIVKGDRVVTARNGHGRVEHVDAWEVSGRTRQTEYRFQVRLDSGRLEPYQSVLYQEVRPPERVLPDLSFDGKNFLSPAEAWKRLKTDYTQIGYYLEKADRARRADAIQEHKRGAADSQARLLRHFAIFYTWRAQHPDVEIEGLVSHLYRILELMSGATPRFRRELDTLKRLPQDQEWGDELVTGDGVIWNQTGSGEQVYGRITAIDNRIATVAPRYGGAPVRLPLYALLLDGRTPLQVPTHSEPVYLVTLASSMLPPNDRTFKRGAAAAAVKRFLAHHKIDARTQVTDGAGMTVTYVHAPEGMAWTPEEAAFMERALDLKVSRNRETSFEPWRTAAAESSLYDDSAGKGAGIRIAAEHVPTFAPLLAVALRESGHVLNRLGTAWLMRGVPPANVPGQSTSSTIHGELSGTDEQRDPAIPQGESPVEGCRELEFHLPGYGQIRVVCGAQGRRDVWHNVFVSRVRYGFNGSRWSKGMKPDPAVLNAVADKGITVFGGRRVYEHAENIRYA